MAVTYWNCSIGSEALKRLQHSMFLWWGWAVWGHTLLEMICRHGVGKMTIVDGDKIQATNRNRQLPALTEYRGNPEKRVMGISYWN